MVKRMILTGEILKKEKLPMKKMIIKIRKPKTKLVLYLLLIVSGMFFSQPTAISAEKKNVSNDQKNIIPAAEEARHYHKHHIIVKFLPEVEIEIKKGNKLNIPNKLKRGLARGKGWWQVEVESGQSVEALLDKFSKIYSDKVQYVQYDYKCSTQVVDQKADVDSEAISLQYLDEGSSVINSQLLWYLQDINMNRTRSVTPGDPSVVIAVLDTGIAYEDAPIETYAYFRVSSLSTGYKKAPGLGNMYKWVNSQEIPNNDWDDDGNGYVDDVNGFDFIDYDGYPHDDNGHGTFLTNLIAYDLEAEDPLGIAPQCTIMIVKVLDNRGRGLASSIAEGIYYAVDHGARVINLSLAWPPGLDPGPVVAEAVAYAANAGVIMIAGTGNDGTTTKICYPAAYPEVIAVGGTQLDLTRALYSNAGPGTEIMAPGGNCYLDQDMDGYPDGILQETLNPKFYITPTGEEILANPSLFGYVFLQGTSLSTAITTGVAGLMISLDPNMDLTTMRDILHGTATDLGPAGWDTEYGYGLINIDGAISVILNGWPDPNAVVPYDLNTTVPSDPNTSVPIITEDPDSTVPVDPGTTIPVDPDITVPEDPNTSPPVLIQTCPECLTDLEIETECDDIETECDGSLNDEESECYVETSCDEETECDDSDLEVECDDSSTEPVIDDSSMEPVIKPKHRISK